MTWIGFLGLTFSVGMLVAGLLISLRWILDRLHPVKTEETKLSDAWERRFQTLKEEVDSLTMGSKLRANNRNEEL